MRVETKTAGKEAKIPPNNGLKNLEARTAAPIIIPAKRALAKRFKPLYSVFCPTTDNALNVFSKRIVLTIRTTIQIPSPPTKVIKV